ncbi:hypothetical protein Dsin_001681 [Dipteronia sinensis]|uniref:RNase H type-1 domain-containing protein n=1 Tax=Dipteronia sinensis TaxID=43782 RepID=A0AAE0B5Q6_9ROSI|nr:hypothetical protein Dsin_001681 [Dipteronia sinensis]
MASCSQRLDASYSPKAVEAVALLRGIDFAVDVGMVPVVIESDVLGVVNLVNSGKPSSAEIGLVIDDIVSRLFCRAVGSVSLSLGRQILLPIFLPKWLWI